VPLGLRWLFRSSKGLDHQQLLIFQQLWFHQEVKSLFSILDRLGIRKSCFNCGGSLLLCLLVRRLMDIVVIITEVYLLSATYRILSNINSISDRHFKGCYSIVFFITEIKTKFVQTQLNSTYYTELHIHTHICLHSINPNKVKKKNHLDVESVNYIYTYVCVCLWKVCVKFTISKVDSQTTMYYKNLTLQTI
jgi:hypothetical protein